MMNYKALLRRLRVSVALIATLFAVSALATSQTESVIYNFPSVEQSQLTVCGPHGNLVADAAGNFYGTDAGCDPVTATVYEIVRPVPPSKQWNRKVLHTFTGSADGGDPMTGLTFDNAGNLYGTANSGGAFGLGVVFQLVHPATPGGQWTEIVIHSFAGPPNDGSSPGETGVVFDKSGNLYGATPLGGITKDENPLCGDGLYYATTSCGVVFQMTPPLTTGGEWGETVIHYFDYTHGAFPVGTPIFDAQGNLYGTTYGGGPHRGGSAYRLNHPVTAGDPWKFRVLYTFPNDIFTDVSYPAGSLTLHGTGELYGNAGGGGSDYGGVFQLVPPTVAGGAWTENVLHDFSYGGDGLYPNANVLFDKSGNLYGTTGSGGVGGSPFCYQGCGTVFEISPPASPGGTWTETILHRFPGGQYDGVKPSTGLIFSKDASLVGVTHDGGKLGSGMVYKITP